MKNISLELSGLYKCVVSAESPFQTLSGLKEVMVVGEGMYIFCSFMIMKHLTFFLDFQRVQTHGTPKSILFN